MIPRKRIDIDWRDLAYGLLASLLARDRKGAQSAVEHYWSAHGDALAALSVRSAFDLVLQQLTLPQGSEVLVSAVTIHDMVAVIEHHGLVAVPVDLDPASCAVNLDALTAAITPRTRAVVVAHLFGSRMPMDAVVELAQRHGLFLFEDCAQAFATDAYRGRAGSDVTHFSFGAIKTATAGGRALCRFRDTQLRNSVATRQRDYPPQPVTRFIRKLCKLAILKALGGRLPYTLFVALCRLAGRAHDDVISRATRGFAGGALIQQLRQQPPAAMLALLERRLRAMTADDLAPRIAAAVSLRNQLPAQRHPGAASACHCHWVLPIRSEQPDALVSHLCEQGFDATRGASSLYAVPAPTDHAAAVQAHRMMAEIVYLPFDTCASADEIARLAGAIMRFEQKPDTANGGQHQS